MALCSYANYLVKFKKETIVLRSSWVPLQWRYLCSTSLAGARHGWSSVGTVNVLHIDSCARVSDVQTYIKMLRQTTAKCISSLHRGLAPNRRTCLLQLPAQAAYSRAKPLQASNSATNISSSVYCDDASSLAQALAAIREAGSCVLDCEGHELGDAQGRLTIIQAVPLGANDVSYIIDVQALEQQQLSLQPLKQLLADPAVTKILYDCRNDACALWYELNCMCSLV
jgi:hypothetical protein